MNSDERRASMNGASRTTPKTSPSTIMVVLTPPAERSASSIITGLKPQPAAVTSDSATTVAGGHAARRPAGALERRSVGLGLVVPSSAR